MAEEYTLTIVDAKTGDPAWKAKVDEEDWLRFKHLTWRSSFDNNRKNWGTPYTLMRHEGAVRGWTLGQACMDVPLGSNNSVRRRTLDDWRDFRRSNLNVWPARPRRSKVDGGEPEADASDGLRGEIRKRAERFLMEHTGNTFGVELLTDFTAELGQSLLTILMELETRP